MDSWVLSSGLNKLLGLGLMVRESNFCGKNKKNNKNLKCVKYHNYSKKILFSELKEGQIKL